MGCCRCWTTAADTTAAGTEQLSTNGSQLLPESLSVRSESQKSSEKILTQWPCHSSCWLSMTCQQQADSRVQLHLQAAWWNGILLGPSTNCHIISYPLPQPGICHILPSLLQSTKERQPHFRRFPPRSDSKYITDQHKADNTAEPTALDTAVHLMNTAWQIRAKLENSGRATPCATAQGLKAMHAPPRRRVWAFMSQLQHTWPYLPGEAAVACYTTACLMCIHVRVRDGRANGYGLASRLQTCSPLVLPDECLWALQEQLVLSAQPVGCRPCHTVVREAFARTL